MKQAHVSVPVHDRPPAAAVVSPAGSDDCDSDADHPLQEPEFVIHALDDRRWPRAPAPAPHFGGGRHPLPPPPPPPRDHDAARREAERIEHLLMNMLLPQYILCCATLIFCGFMIYLALHPDMFPSLTWVIVYSALIMAAALISALLSHIGVYCN